MMKKIKVYFDTLLDIVFPFYEECLYCGKSIEAVKEKYLCNECSSELIPIEHGCEVCSYPMKSSMQIVCNDCIMYDSYMDEFYSLYLMDDCSRKNIHKYKYNHDKFFAVFYAKLLLDGIIVRYSDFDFDGIACIPSTKKRIRERGFDHIYEIVRHVASALDVPLWDILERAHHKKSQTLLTRSERLKEINNSFVLKISENKPKKLLLIDDIYTTGATMEEAARVLQEGGIRVSGITIFRSKKNK